MHRHPDRRPLTSGPDDPSARLARLGGPAPSLYPAEPPPGHVLVAVASVCRDGIPLYSAVAILGPDPAALEPVADDVLVLYFRVPAAALAADFPAADLTP